MSRFIFFLLALFPRLEVFLRVFWGKHRKLKERALKFFTASVKNKPQIEEGLWQSVKDSLLALDIREGDMLLVHSSMDGLSPTGASASEIIDFLLSLVGESGTLVMPAYPDEKAMLKRHTVPYYNPKKTMPWTGLLPALFCRRKDVVRSPFPHNSLAARGPLALAMVEKNLEGDLSQGKNSAWDFCIQHGMKILSLGVDPCEPSTIIHYPEDILDEDWPISDWYEYKTYTIKIDDNEIEKTIRERKLRWYQYFCLFYEGKWAIKNNFMSYKKVGNVKIGFVKDSKRLACEYVRLAKNKKIFYRIPKKFWKKS